MSTSAWDEAWRCPVGHVEIGMGSGKRGGGNAVVEFTEPPRCFCGREMEQATKIFIEPGEIDAA